MKNKFLIPVMALLFIVLGVFGFLLFNDKVAYYITLDINPSIKINLNKNQEVINVVALNEDAKKIVNGNFKGKTLENTIDIITENLTKEGFGEKQNDIYLYSSNLNSEEIKEKITSVFAERHFEVNIIVVNNVSKDDEKLAKDYNISPAKASIINEIIKENESVEVKSLINKNIDELNETARTGNYCNDGYILEGDFCLKEIERKTAQSGKICPIGYLEYNGKCYEETPVEETDNLVCRDEFTLQGDNCVRKQIVDATITKYSCPKGEVRTRAEVGDAPYDSGPANEAVCVDPSKITHPVTPCGLPASDPTERTSVGGKCYWHRAPIIEAGCPGKIQINCFCWDDASDVYLCPNSKNSNKLTKDDNCYVVLNVKATPSEYKCEDSSMKLEGTKCIKEEIEPAEHEKVCPGGYKLINNDRCINLNNTTSLVDGYICNYENSKLYGNSCIIYDIVNAKRY